MQQEIDREFQLKNWQNFCQYHIGDWHGNWYVYSAQAEHIDSFLGIRSFILSADRSTIYHHNHYFYKSDRTESKTFGPYYKPITRAIFLENSFTWGSKSVESDNQFFCETGFSYNDRRASAVLVYDENRQFSQALVIPEHRSTKAEAASVTISDDFTNSCQGTRQTIAGNLIWPPSETNFQLLEHFGEDYLTVKAEEGISFCLPKQIEPGKELFFVVDWLVHPRLLQRGIRYFQQGFFHSFHLEIFRI